MGVNESSWVKWTRNGRLSFAVWLVVSAAWVTFKIRGIPLEGLDTVFILMSGLLAGNLGITVIKPSELKPKKADDADG